MEKNHMTGGVAGAVAHVEGEFADGDLVAVLKPAGWCERAGLGDNLAVMVLDQLVDPKLVLALRPFDRHAMALLKGVGGAGVIDMAVGDENFLQPQVIGRQLFVNPVQLTAGIDRRRLFGRLTPDQRTILLVRGVRNNDRFQHRAFLAAAPGVAPWDDICPITPYLSRGAIVEHANMAEKHELNWNDETSSPPRLSGRRMGRWSAFGVAGVILAIAAYYLLGMLFIHRVSDDVDFAAPPAPGESHAVALAAGLIHREVDVNRWTANDPWVIPSSLLDNMPHFQQGVIYALSRFAIEMSDQIGRTRGSSEVDKNLDKAAGLLKYPGDIWVFDLSTSLMPTATSEKQYRAARRELLAYNQRLAAGAAVFDRRADNLLATVDRFAADLGSASATIDQHLSESGGPLVDFVVDDIFYRTKGRLYAYFLLLKALGEDFAPVLKERQVATVYGQMLTSLAAAARLDPLIVVGGTPDGLYFPNHLAVQGFYLLRARTQLREIANILQK